MKSGYAHNTEIETDMKRQGSVGAMPHPAQRIALELHIRSRFFNDALFNDPCWNIVLACFAAKEAGQVFTVADALVQARTSRETARRWLNVLRSEGWLTIEGTMRPNDVVNLTRTSRDAMMEYLDRLKSLGLERT